MAQSGGADVLAGFQPTSNTTPARPKVSPAPLRKVNGSPIQSAATRAENSGAVDVRITP